MKMWVQWNYKFNFLYAHEQWIVKKYVGNAITFFLSFLPPKTAFAIKKINSSWYSLFMVTVQFVSKCNQRMNGSFRASSSGESFVTFDEFIQNYTRMHNEKNSTGHIPFKLWTLWIIYWTLQTPPHVFFFVFGHEDELAIPDMTLNSWGGKRKMRYIARKN